jgi:hypothetical protein
MAHELIKGFHEVIGEIAPTTATFGMDGGSAQMEIEVKRADLPTVMQKIMGTTILDKNTGRLLRFIPLSHPDFPWMYASRITSLQGLGADGYNNGDNFLFPGFAHLDRILPARIGLYRYYKVVVQFEPRPYSIVTDDQLHALASPSSYYLGNNVVNFTDYKEYLRYTTVTSDPQTEFLTTNIGSYFLHSAELPNNPQQVTPTSAGGPRLTVCKNRFAVTWYMVPYRLINNINFTVGRGKVNQEEVISSGVKTRFLGRPEGSLLLDGVKFTPNPGPYPALAVTGVTESDLESALFDTRYCDVTFDFTEFTIPENQAARVPSDVPAWAVKDNHNRLPHMGLMKYLYASNSNLPSTGKPIYEGFNMRALFVWGGQA